MCKDNQTEKVAIVLPVFNVSKYLNACLESILNQTFNNFTIFAIDDGSTDNSGKILDEYALRDTRITVVHKNNKGLAAARNCALELIENQGIYSYISFIDSDDIISSDFLSKHLLNIKKADADVSVCGFLLLANDGSLHQQNHLLSERTFSGEEYINLIFSKNEWSNACGAGGMVWKQIYRAEIIHSLRFPENRLVLEDEPFGVMVAQRAKMFVYFPETLYFYRQSNTSLCKESNFQIRRLNGRKLCYNNFDNVSKTAQLVIFASYIESVLSLIKQNQSTIDLKPYKILVDQAYHAKVMAKKTLLIFYLFCNFPICSRVYIYARIAFRRLRSLLGLRV